jgi:hypothetical protein
VKIHEAILIDEEVTIKKLEAENFKLKNELLNLFKK